MKRSSLHLAGPRLAWALALLPLLALGAPARAPSGLSLSASPRQLLAGRDEVATLTVRGAPEQLKDVRLSCTAGTVRNVRKGKANGEVVAEYVPPRSSSATWVLCAAVGGGATGGLVGLELQRREMLALTGLPSLSRVLVKMGEALVGPVRANAVGYVEVPVTLTPSCPQAEVQATPPGKPTETRLHPLAVVTSEQVVLMTAADQVMADGTRSLPVYAFTLGQDGEPRDLPLSFNATDGAISMRRAGTGMWTGLYTPRARVERGEATLSARVPNGRPVTTKVELLEGLEPRLALDASARELTADGLSTAELKILVADQFGKALPGPLPRLNAQRGQVGPLQERSPGVFVAQYTVPSGAGPELVTAELPGAAPVTLALRLLAPPRLLLEVTPSRLPADGKSRAVVSILARDPEGRELPEGTPVHLRASRGTVPAEVKTSHGRAQVELVADKAAGEAMVEVTALDAEAHASVRMLPGEPAHLLVKSERTAVLCDGRDGTDLHLFVQDANGNGLDAVPVQVALAGPRERRVGRLDRVAALGNGEFIARYHAPEDCVSGPLAVEAVAAGLSSQQELTLSRTFPRLVAATVSAGAQSNLDTLLWSVVQVEGESNTGLMADRLLATASLRLGYTRFTTSGQANTAGAFTARVQMLLTSLSLGPRLTVLQRGPVSAFVGAGLDIFLVDVDSTYVLLERPDQPSQENVLPPPTLGVHGRAGVGVALGAGTLVLEARYGFARLDAPKQHLLVDQLAGLSGTVGYRVTF